MLCYRSCYVTEFMLCILQIDHIIISHYIDNCKIIVYNVPILYLKIICLKYK